MIQIRNVPTDTHRKLKARAAEAGMSLSDYLLRIVEKSALIPTEAEFKERLEKLPPVNISSEEIVKAIREGREERDEQLFEALTARDRR